MKAVLAPRITATGIPGFLLWARRDNPALYNAMAQQLPEVAEFEAALRTEGMSGLLDTLKSFGSSLASSASKIGSFVAKNALPLAAAVVPLVVAKKQADVSKAQYKLAAAQMAPMQTAMIDPATGLSVPVQQMNGVWQQVPLQGAAVTQMQAIAAQARAQSNPLSQPVMGLPLWGWLAGAGAAGLVLLSRR